jgi:hypothetical protein
MKLSVELQPDGYWVAIDLDDYEGESDAVGAWCNSPVGYGRTREKAVYDLFDDIVRRVARSRKLRNEAT